MNRELLIAVAAATAIASVAGCSSGTKTPAPTSSSSAAPSSASGSPGAATPPAAPAPATPPAKVTLDGQQMPVTDPVDCNSKDGKFSIAIGQPFIGVIAALEQDASVVHLVGLGDVNGLNYNFNEGVPGENASATKNGNTYHITGVANGTDNMGKKQAQKPFTIDVTCP
ncbi:lipoprotein LpqH [Mycobacterium numidiamassiliense]|uniref:lipoprotein LpqH n=1 Tax=Mycobacterium numidiamassiliense TaxID=1841861 RepID=UPI00097D73AB|nr:lipoprotein LpqH [Mycobacterium numidiamassiliense]